MKIGELAAGAGLNTSAVRYYEKMGLLAPPARASGQRRYPSDALDRLLLIRFAGDMGFTLEEIKLFLHGFRESVPVSARWKKLAGRKIVEIQEQVLRLRRLLKVLGCLQHCRCVSLKQCVNGLSLSPSLPLLRIRPPRKNKPAHAA